MLRKLNFTGRRRIKNDHVKITLVDRRPALPTFTAKVDLAPYKSLPGEANVFVDAHDKSSFQRFPFGTVQSVTSALQRTLDEIQRPDAIAFVVKVVDAEGHLLAASHPIRPEREDDTDESASSGSILGTRFTDLGHEVWRLDFSGERPVLELNEKLHDIGIREMARTNDMFRGLVFPAAMREILTRAVIVDGVHSTDGDEWQHLWLRFANFFYSESPPQVVDRAESDLELAHRWVSEAVEAFSGSFGWRERFEAAFTTGAA